jgi:hypothetical protein
LDILPNDSGVRGGDRVGIAGVGEKPVREARREGQRIGAYAVVEGLGARAVEMGRLIPLEIEVVLAGFRQLVTIILIAVADVAGPSVDLVQPITAAGRPIAVQERPRLY